jgi:lactoylglutathione lyase
MNSNLLQLELHVDDFSSIEEYYVALGFKKVWKRNPEDFKGYLVLEMNGNTLCFWAGNEHVYEQEYFKQFPKTTPRGYGVEIVVMVPGIEAYYEIHKNNANVVEPLKLQPWGMKDFRAVDPAGFYLRFTSEHDIHDPTNAVE